VRQYVVGVGFSLMLSRQHGHCVGGEGFWCQSAILVRIGFDFWKRDSGHFANPEHFIDKAFFVHLQVFRIDSHRPSSLFHQIRLHGVVKVVKGFYHEEIHWQESHAFQHGFTHERFVHVVIVLARDEQFSLHAPSLPVSV
jgi:hypothetical protein